MAQPETRMVLLTKEDGSVATMTLIRQPDGSWPTVEECLGKWLPEKRAEIKKMRALDESELPTNRTFRNAWRDNGKIEVDMPAAREIWRGTLRKLREPLLSALDVSYQRADEAGDEVAKKRVAKQKQELRDVTADPAIEQAQTPEELVAVIPAALQGEPK